LALGGACFALLPTLPPWLVEPTAVTRATSLILSRSLGIDMTGVSSTGLAAGYTFEVNHSAAMPSVHVATTVLLALTVMTPWPRTRRAAWLYPLAMSVAVVYLGEHYELDALGGWTVALVAWAASRDVIGNLWMLSRPTRAFGQCPGNEPARQRGHHHSQRHERGGRWRVGSNRSGVVQQGEIDRLPSSDR